MSHLRVKTTYEVEGAYGSTETRELYCHHNHSCDCVTFHGKNGEVESMAFCDWSTNNNDLWDAMNRLWLPFKKDWGGELKEGVEYYYKEPWKVEAQ